jgi:hypothetical protein
LLLGVIESDFLPRLERGNSGGIGHARRIDDLETAGVLVEQSVIENPGHGVPIFSAGVPLIEIAPRTSLCRHTNSIPVPEFPKQANSKPRRRIRGAEVYAGQ